MAELLESAPLVIGALKRLVARGHAGRPDRAHGRDQPDHRPVRQSEDMQEGIAAYKEKRKPKFKAR